MPRGWHLELEGALGFSDATSQFQWLGLEKNQEFKVRILDVRGVLGQGPQGT